MTAPPEPALHDLAPVDRARVLREAAQALSAIPNVRAAWAHGSFTGPSPFRDLDIGVWFNPPPRWSDPGDLAYAVWQAVGRPAWPVDVQVLNDATPAFRDRVARSGTLLHERAPGDALELTVIARSMLIDQQEWLRAHEEHG